MGCILTLLWQTMPHFSIPVSENLGTSKWMVKPLPKYIPCLKRRLCDSVLTSISEISLKGIDIESCNHRFSRDWLIRFNSQPFVGQKFCRSHRWCLHRTCDGGFLVPFVGSDGWSLGRSLGGKQSPCLCSSDLAGKGRGNVKLKKWGPKIEYGNNETGDLSFSLTLCVFFKVQILVMSHVTLS